MIRFDVNVGNLARLTAIMEVLVLDLLLLAVRDGFRAAMGGQVIHEALRWMRRSLV